MTTRVTDLFPSGTLAARPDPATLPNGALYASSDDRTIYKNVAGAWSAWAVLTGTTDPEVVRDTMGAALLAGAGITITVNDAGDTITITNTGATGKTLNAQSGTAYTLVSADAGKFVTMTNAAASALTVPANATDPIPVNTIIEGAQLGAGQVTITAASGVTINATPGLKVAAQYGTFGLLKTGTDTWLAYGRLSA